MSVPPLSLAAIRQPAFLYGPDGRIAEANDLAEALAGRPLIGCSAADVIAIFGNRHPDGTVFVPEELPPTRALAGEEVIDVPMVVTAVGGRDVHLMVTASPVRDGDAIAGALVVWQDVTEQKRTEAALHESEERFRSVLDNSRDVFVRVNLQTGRYEYVSPSVTALGGYSPDEFVSMDRETALAMVHPDDVHVLRTAQARSEEAGAAEAEYRQRAKSGEWVWVSNRMSTVRDDEGRPLYRINSIRDITERKRAEEVLQTSEKKYRMLVDSIDEGYFMIDVIVDEDDRPVDLLYVEANAAATRMLGRDYTGLRLTEISPDYEQYWFEIFGEVARTGESVRMERYAVPDQRWYEFSVFKIGGPECRRIGNTFLDITGRKRAEKEIQTLMSSLQKEKERLESLVNSIPDEIWFADTQKKIVLVNPAVLAEFGESAFSQPDVEAIAGGSEVYRPDGTPRPVEEAPPLRALTGEVVRNQEEIVRMPASGELRYRQVNASPVKDDTGNIIGSVSVVRDITKPKQAEEALQQSESLLRSFFDAPGVMQGIVEVIADDDVRHIRDNTVTAAFVGLTTEAIRNKLGSELGEPRDILRAWVARYRRSQETASPVTFEYEDIRNDQRAWLSATVSYLGTSSLGYPQFAYIVSDITERKRAEEALRETRDYLDNLIDYANAPIIVWGPDLRITRFNAAFEHMSGFAADEVIGRELFILFPEESRDDSLQKIQRTITEQWQSVEIPILRPDGGIRIALWNSANIYTTEGTTLLATIAQGQDISERKEAEEALREYAVNLRRSNEDLERYAYVSSHDLQEPLRSIVSFSQLLERRYKGQLGEDADDYINFIVEGGIRMQTLIQDLLAYSRVNTTRQDLRPTDAEDVMASVERSLAVPLLEMGAVITHDPMPVVLADPLQLEQVVANLVSNAIKFRHDDEPLRIHVGARRMNGFWEFSVNDNGIGIEAQYLDQIFVIFQRLHTKDAYPGTGIGLAIVKRIIDRHGGRVWVESTPGEGATFFFTLPAA